MLSKNLSSFLRPLKNKGLEEEIVTKIGLYDIDKSTTLESNKSLQGSPECSCRTRGAWYVIERFVGTSWRVAMQGSACRRGAAFHPTTLMTKARADQPAGDV